MDDRIIIERVQSGEVDAYALLVERYHRKLLAFIFRIVKDEHLAEDIGQEVFLKVYQELPRFEPERGTPLLAWLYIVARNQCITELRRRERTEPLAPEELLKLASDAESAEQSLLRQEEWEAMQGILQDLPEPFRSTIGMSLKGATLGEIARRSGVPQSTVKTRIFRAKEKILLLWRGQFGGVGHEGNV